MGSLIPGYEYDIFISYRQKDNKHDGWVTEFVNQLKGELESTFKEDISVYFDINPHDGLLETHDVNASLSDKLKCLVFIPIISRTYCDTKSFAWEHEFKAFVEQASQDQFGLKVKLPNGNVASRVLPLRIYDLESSDIKIFESMLGGIIRGVEFIYKSPGVNRPLRSKEENPQDNLNHTIYRDQINRVGNAIKEIISGLLTEAYARNKEEIIGKERFVEDKRQSRDFVKINPAKIFKSRMLSVIAIIALLVIAAVFLYPKIFKNNTLEKLRSSGGKISVAVLPFQNTTNDTLWNIWQAGIQNELITYLTNIEELKVRQSGTVNSLLQSKNMINYASINPASFGIISRNLEVAVLISGSINQAGSIIRINAQINDPETDDILKSFQIESPAKEELIFKIIDSLSVRIRDFLLITKLKQESPVRRAYGISTDSPEAYRHFVSGNNAFFKIMDYPAAVKLYSQAIAIDSNLHSAKTMLSTTYYNQGEFDSAKKWCLKVYEKRNQLSLYQNIHISWLYAMLFETPKEEIKCLNQRLEIDDQSPAVYYELGRIYVALAQYDKAISAINKTLKQYKKWGSKPRWSQEYIMLGYAFQKTDRYRKEYRLYKKAAKDFPDDQELIYRQAVLALLEGRLKDANSFIEKYLYNLKTNFTSATDITETMGHLYLDANILDKAGEHFREACSLDPDNPGRLNTLAYFLIDEDQNIKEGMELADKALEFSPDNYKYLNTKGWGLYKQGKYKDALNILQKSWDIRREKAVYNHEAFLHLEAAKKAVAEQIN